MWVYSWVPVCGLLFCSIDLCLFLCQYHSVLITVALQYSLKSGMDIPLVLFFFLRITLAILALLQFCIHFGIIYSSFVKNLLVILTGIGQNLLNPSPSGCVSVLV